MQNASRWRRGDEMAYGKGGKKGGKKKGGKGKPGKGGKAK